jgi:hypothetical protein
MRAGRTSTHIAILVLSARMGLCCASVAAQDRVAALQTEFDRETNAVRKAKLIHKLGDAQFQEARRYGDAGDYDAVAKWMESYRDDAETALAALKAFHPDGERHPEGYKEMHIHMRKSLRVLEETILETPDSYRARLEAVRKDLIGVEDQLMAALFPRPPGKSPGKAPKKMPAKPQDNPPPPAQGAWS